MNLAVIAGVIALGCGAGLIAAFRLLMEASKSGLEVEVPEGDPVETFRAASYRPMERLLEERDQAFLARQAGYNAELGRRLRVRRARIFHAYLRCLSSDFGRLHKAARVILRDCGEDRPDLAGELMRQDLRFRFAMAGARFRLAAFALGLGAFSMPAQARALIDAAERLHADVRTLAVAPAVMGA